MHFLKLFLFTSRLTVLPTIETATVKHTSMCLNQNLLVFKYECNAMYTCTCLNPEQTEGKHSLRREAVNRIEVWQAMMPKSRGFNLICDQTITMDILGIVQDQ